MREAGETAMFFSFPLRHYSPVLQKDERPSPFFAAALAMIRNHEHIEVQDSCRRENK